MRSPAHMGGPKRHGGRRTRRGKYHMGKSVDALAKGNRRMAEVEMSFAEQHDIRDRARKYKLYTPKDGMSDTRARYKDWLRKRPKRRNRR